jgi:phospholipid/cholesterol/gamma-HCH transport system substrate-binding protein
VSNVKLDPTNYKALVTIRLNENHSNIPTDSAASIVTAGILGSNYIAISPGFDEQFLKNGDRIQETHPALILEEMIGQLLFSMKKDDGDKKEQI